MAVIPKQEITDIKFTDSRKAYGQQYASITFNSRGNRKQLGEYMSYMNSIRYWSEDSEWQLYVVTGRYTETKDTREERVSQHGLAGAQEDLHRKVSEGR